MKNTLAEIGLYKTNLREGDWKFYWGDSSLWKVTPYENGLKERLEKVYSGAKITETINYKLNHQNGLNTKFRYDGGLKSKETFLKDKLIDTSYYYTYSNKLEKKCFNGADTSFASIIIVLRTLKFSTLFSITVTKSQFYLKLI